MNSSNAAALKPDYASHVDTFLKLPDRMGSFALAAACRETALAFLNDSPYWGKAELSMWLMGPYAQLCSYVPAISRSDDPRSSRPFSLLSDIDVRMVGRMIQAARTEVLETVQHLAAVEGGTTFGYSMLSSGFVARCEDGGHVAGWAPTTVARRLADRVLSLIAADYLTHASVYETQFALCSHCGIAEFDSMSRARGVFQQNYRESFFSDSRNTSPYLPEGA